MEGRDWSVVYVVTELKEGIVTIPMSTTTRAMLDPEADGIDAQTDTSAHDYLY